MTISKVYWFFIAVVTTTSSAFSFECSIYDIKENEIVLKKNFQTDRDHYYYVTVNEHKVINDQLVTTNKIHIDIFVQINGYVGMTVKSRHAMRTSYNLIPPYFGQPLEYLFLKSNDWPHLANDYLVRCSIK